MPRYQIRCGDQVLYEDRFPTAGAADRQAETYASVDGEPIEVWERVNIITIVSSPPKVIHGKLRRRR